MNYQRCYDEQCTLAHLKGTERKRPPKQWQNTSTRTQRCFPSNARNTNLGLTSRRQHYSAVDPQMLGFRGYLPPRKQHRGFCPQQPNDHGNIEANKQQYLYNEREFPAVQTNHEVHSRAVNQEASKHVYSDNNFLDLLQSIKEIQNTQITFQQELLSIKAQISPHQTHHQMPWHHYMDPQFLQQTHQNKDILMLTLMLYFF